ncbi:type III secretion system export apparatus subunit SctT [Aestuariispira insulae]|uniref:Type III secretion protein T n=1 Tax=Aestuariispira insulae TaxID=1461337 RepID=A0A3D9H2J8_9PROT|nr:type III secretion system export apparatus subunit SctT [Aestuariispira insulae]RED43738.1 type III secretion protein T [Aestuariispira insulae]
MEDTIIPLLHELFGGGGQMDLSRIVGGVLLSSCRLFAFMAITPIFQRAIVPPAIMGVLGFSLALMAFPRVWGALSHAVFMDMWYMASILAKEILLGLLIGMVAGFPYWALETAGTVIDTQRGASAGSTSSPITQDEVQPLGAFFGFLYLIWLFISGAFDLLLGIVYDSYLVWPVLSFFPDLAARDAVFYLDLLDNMMELALIIAGPIMLMMFLSELALVFVTRFAPQLNVFVLAMPIKSGIAFLIILMFLPGLFAVMEDGFEFQRALIRDLFGMFSYER